MTTDHFSQFLVRWLITLNFCYLVYLGYIRWPLIIFMILTAVKNDLVAFHLGKLVKAVNTYLED
jgi:hypothetical protein